MNQSHYASVSSRYANASSHCENVSIRCESVIVRQIHYVNVWIRYVSGSHYANVWNRCRYVNDASHCGNVDQILTCYASVVSCQLHCRCGYATCVLGLVSGFLCAEILRLPELELVHLVATRALLPPRLKSNQSHCPEVFLRLRH